MTHSRLYEDIIEEARKLTPLDVLDESKSYIGGGTLFDAYCQTLCGNRLAEVRIPPIPRDLGEVKGKEVFRTILGQEAAAGIEESARKAAPFDATTKVYLHTMREVFGGKLEYIWAFFNTEEDYIGLAPEFTSPGDIVCVFLGCYVPIILRPTHASSKKQYRVVGQCYIHGLMNGEAILG